MRFAVILHGPEVLDKGLGQEVIRLLGGQGQVRTVMSGITGVAAVIDAGLEGQVDISRRLKPSVELASMDKQADFLLLVNCAKSRESAVRFGQIVYSRCRAALTKPYVQVDDGILIDWSGEGGSIAGMLVERLGLELLTRVETGEGERCPEGWRRLGGVLPGEHVWVNGVVVGRAISRTVMISKGQDGRLVAQGMSLKDTGVRRLGDFNVAKAHVRSGLTRRTSATPRAISSAKEGIFLIDHDAESAAYKCRDASLVITVGDDTSRIAGAILYRFDVPVVSLTDGDEDGISMEALKAKGSVTMVLRPGTDDIVGAEVRRAFFNGADRVPGQMAPAEAAARVSILAGDRLIRMETAP
jgi:hypothetical protein